MQDGSTAKQSGPKPRGPGGRPLSEARVALVHAGSTPGQSQRVTGWVLAPLAHQPALGFSFLTRKRGDYVVVGSSHSCGSKMHRFLVTVLAPSLASGTRKELVGVGWGGVGWGRSSCPRAGWLEMVALSTGSGHMPSAHDRIPQLDTTGTKMIGSRLGHRSGARQLLSRSARFSLT